MKLKIAKNQLQDNYTRWLRQAGYHYRPGRNGQPANFTRPVAGPPYPRFHIYVEDLGQEIIINLHLDQKRPSYTGASAHNAEYEGQVVAEEISRLKKFIIL